MGTASNSTVYGSPLSGPSLKFPFSILHTVSISGGWKLYDNTFRQQAANNPAVDWAKINSLLYATTFLAQSNGKGMTCVHCMETDQCLCCGTSTREESGYGCGGACLSQASAQWGPRRAWEPQGVYQKALSPEGGCIPKGGDHVLFLQRWKMRGMQVRAYLFEVP